MVKITRLLEYEFPSIAEAVKQLNNRGVKGTQAWANCAITERFYWTSDVDVATVLHRVLTRESKEGPPDESK